MSTAPTTAQPAAGTAPGAGLSKGALIGAWVAQLIAAGILGMGAFLKFLGPGPGALAEALSVSNAAVYAIGVLETIGVLLLLIPRLHAVGAVVAIGLMGGAFLSHVFVIGFSGDVGSMWMLSLIALAAAVAALVIRRRELPFVGARG